MSSAARSCIFVLFFTILIVASTLVLMFLRQFSAMVYFFRKVFPPHMRIKWSFPKWTCIVYIQMALFCKNNLLQVYMPNTRKGLGVSHLVNGSDYYKACLKWHTSLDISPEEVHQKGLNEVDRIAKEMEKVK